MKRVFVAGEGPNEIGRWCREAAYRGEYPSDDAGVIGALLGRVATSPYDITEGAPWKRSGTFRAGRRDGEYKAARRLIQDAADHGCDVAVLVRDADDVPGRAAEIERAAVDALRDGILPRVAAGVAVERLENWLLAMTGEARSEQLGRQQVRAKLDAAGVPDKDTHAMVGLASRWALEALPVDAASLRAWLDRARDALAP